MNKYDISSSKKITELTCPHCQQPNPETGYRCKFCDEIMFPKKNLIPFNTPIRPSVAIVVILIALLWAGYVVAKHWLEAIEAQMTLHVHTDDYNVSIVADKKKGKMDVDSQMEKEPVVENSPTQ